MGALGHCSGPLVLGLDGGASGQRRTVAATCWREAAGLASRLRDGSWPGQLPLHVGGPSSPAHELIPARALASHQTWPLCPVLCERFQEPLGSRAPRHLELGWARVHPTRRPCCTL